MTNRTRPGILPTALVASSILAFSEPSHAYLDPGTGSIILQSILAGVAVAIGFVRLYWHRFKSFLSSLAGSATDTSETEYQETVQDSENSSSS